MFVKLTGFKKSLPPTLKAAMLNAPLPLLPFPTQTAWFCCLEADRFCVSASLKLQLPSRSRLGVAKEKQNTKSTSGKSTKQTQFNWRQRGVEHGWLKASSHSHRCTHFKFYSSSVIHYWVPQITFDLWESTCCQFLRSSSIGLSASHDALDRPRPRNLVPACYATVFPLLSLDRDRMGWKIQVCETRSAWHHWPSPPWRRLPRLILRSVGGSCGEASCDTAGNWVRAVVFNDAEASR